MSQVFISRQPLVNRQNRILANRLTLLPVGEVKATDIAETMEDIATRWPQGEKQIFIDYGTLACNAESLNWSIPESAVIELSPASFATEDTTALASILQATRPSICLKYTPDVEGAFNQNLSFRFIAFDMQTTSPQALKSLAAQMQSHGIAVAMDVKDVSTFQACLDAGVNAASGWFFKHMVKPAASKTLNPSHAHIIQLLNLVRKNADIREIETALKQDVALSYKLLRYINSAGFGLSCEVQSFKHAVTILGYNKLNKWLSLLLATASKDPMAPAMTHTALVRARLMETLAQGLVDKQEYDNLFITGAFSMLDILLGVSMERVLESMSLPESICDALLGNGGIYGPFLDLAKAGEGKDGEALAEQAGMLGLSAEQFNRAQIAALEFAEAMAF